MKKIWYRFMAWSIRKSSPLAFLAFGNVILGGLAYLICSTTTAEDMENYYKEKRRNKSK